MEKFKIISVSNIALLEQALNEAMEWDFSNGEWTSDGVFVVIARKRSTPSTDSNRYKVLYNSDYSRLQKAMNEIAGTYDLIDGEIFSKSYLYLAIMCVPNGRESTGGSGGRESLCGYVSPTEPAGTVGVNEVWYASTTLPTVFPINVKRYDGTAWSTTTEEYTPQNFDAWYNQNDGKIYQWLVDTWEVGTQVTKVDNVTIRYNSGKLEVKDQGISFTKLNDELISQNIPVTDASANKLTSESAVATYIQGKLSYVHEQGSPLAVWEIVHNLNYCPSVTVIDSGNTQVIGDVTYTNANSLKITFSGAMSGKAYLS